jgi:hypothetical protein
MINLELEIKVLSLNIEDNLIKVLYIIPDSNTKYEYKIEMSDNI